MDEDFSYCEDTRRGQLSTSEITSSGENRHLLQSLEDARDLGMSRPGGGSSFLTAGLLLQLGTTVWGFAAFVLFCSQRSLNQVKGKASGSNADYSRVSRAGGTQPYPPLPPTRRSGALAPRGLAAALPTQLLPGRSAAPASICPTRHHTHNNLVETEPRWDKREKTAERLRDASGPGNHFSSRPKQAGREAAAPAFPSGSAILGRSRRQQVAPYRRRMEAQRNRGGGERVSPAPSSQGDGTGRDGGGGGGGSETLPCAPSV